MGPNNRVFIHCNERMIVLGEIVHATVQHDGQHGCEVDFHDSPKVFLLLKSSHKQQQEQFVGKQLLEKVKTRTE